MKYQTLSLLIVAVFIYQITCACKKNENLPKDSVDVESDDKYQNPVFEPVLADPSIVKVDCCFYAYGTEDNWGEEGGYHLVPVLKSYDLVNWTLVRNAFDSKPDWKDGGGIWAPDVTEVDDQFYMYYSYSKWGDANPGIGLAIAETPEGPFIDQGKVFDSKEIGVDNSIDPFYIEEDGEKYIFWGSFRGIYAVKLTEDGRKPVGDKIKITSNHLEASYVYKHGGYYYFFGSAGSCCDGANSTYRVLVGRSESLMGPYMDQSGRKLVDGSFGVDFLHKNSSATGFVGPGHNAEIITDDDGTDWFIYHAMRKSRAKLNNGTNRRALLIDKISWVNDWPVIEGNQPSVGFIEKPVFKD